MKIYLDDSSCRENLFPFTLTRHTALIRIGITTLKEKWEQLTGYEISGRIDGETISYQHIPANVLPTEENVAQIISYYKKHSVQTQSPEFSYINYPWQIFQYNAGVIGNDCTWKSKQGKTASLPASVVVIGHGKLFVEEGLKIDHAILNVSEGPIYIGKNVTIMEGAMIRGPFAACEGSVVKMGAKIYGGTTLGPYCVAGGEIKNTVFLGYSNKAHDGYLGDSVIGEWCNFGAGSSNSNVKNTGGVVRYQLSPGAEPQPAGTKAGLLMGDYSRCAINTSFNTGSVVGVCCNIFGGMPEKYLHHFSWGKGKYDFNKAIIDIGNWKKMKGLSISEQEIDMLNKLYQKL